MPGLSRIGGSWMPNCALTSAGSTVWGTRGSPRRPSRSPAGWMRRRWWIARPKAETDRRVTIRPAPDCMTQVTVLLPVAQGVGVYAALKNAADTTFDDRSRGQVMADTLVERVTGRPAEAPESVSLNLVMSDQALWGQDNAPAVLDGYGPIPASVAQRLVCDAVVDERAVATLRRLYRHPKTGALVAMESRSRCFPKGLARFIGIRDGTCRTPYCDAPIRHRDHAVPRNRGGPTSAVNGLGECERCNYAKEAPGWTGYRWRGKRCAHRGIRDTDRGALSLDRATTAGCTDDHGQRGRGPNRDRACGSTRGVVDSGARVGRRRTAVAAPTCRH